MTKIADQLVHHERFLTVHKAILATLERARAGDPQILPVIGPTRVGKTKLLKRVAQANSVRNREIILVDSPKHLTGRALPDACLGSIGMSAGMFVNHVAATGALIKALNKYETKLIIFDETQHMLERGGSTTVRAAADFLKGLFDQTQASIVLVGLPSLIGLFQANEQLADRARRPVEFYPYNWAGGDYKGFRSALGGALEFMNEAGWDTFAFNDAEFAKRMYVASAGRYGIINKIFMEVQSANGDRKVAQYKEFAQAYTDAVMGRLVEFNPFDLAQEIKAEHMALVYTRVMQAAGVQI